jgi:predicted aspartyl protease
METDTMGRVLTEAIIENLGDLFDAHRGMMPDSQIRRVRVDDALVDSGATLFSVPTRLIQQLGLKEQYRRRATSSVGVVEATMYDPVRLTIQGRTCTVDVVEVPDSVPVLVGQIPLEQLDFVIDMRNRVLIGNPAHGGEQMLELY